MRVVDAETGALYDRVQIRVERIVTVEATVEASSTGRAAAGARESVVFRLLGVGGDGLVDEGTTITSEDLEVDRVRPRRLRHADPPRGAHVPARREPPPLERPRPVR